jgi:GNAT superfamily N-acetyltransferase
LTVRVELVDAAVTTELRRAVLRPTWAPGTPMNGDDDPNARHVAALDENGRAIGACVLFRNPYPVRPDATDAWQLRGMGTAAELRGQGVGAAVLAGAIATVREQGGRLLWCMARLTAVPFYERGGFSADTDVYIEPVTALPHRDMSLDL